MSFELAYQKLDALVQRHLATDEYDWVQEKLNATLQGPSARELFMAHGQMSTKIAAAPLDDSLLEQDGLEAYLRGQKADTCQLARIYLLHAVLRSNPEFFEPKVAKLIEVADSRELETFLKFLVVLPNPEAFKFTAVEALRTNISTVFNAISMDNPYPSLYFDEQQWNQMYLKAAFMGQDLSRIRDVEKRANAQLARIISDYAHERWAASREIDPLFWRPVTTFMSAGILEDMQRLLQSDNAMENKAAALCCHHSGSQEAATLLDAYPVLKQKIVDQEVTWHNIKDSV
ncbi:MAG: EboA domain-containing protein [Flavobacteriaceae bacterium]